MLRCHLRTAKGSDRLLPGLDVYHQGQHASRALAVPKKVLHTAYLIKKNVINLHKTERTFVSYGFGKIPSNSINV